MESASSLYKVERFFQLCLLGMLASGYFAVASSGYLGWPIQAVTLAAFAARAATVSGWIHFTLPPRAISMLTLGCIVFYPLDYLYISGILPVATLHLMFLLAVLKLITASSDRDYAYLKTIAALELLVAAVMPASFGFFAYLALFLLFTIATFAAGEVRRAARTSTAPVRTGFRSFGRRLGVLCFALTGGILLLTAGLFFVLPRTARAAISHFGAGRYHLPGFTSEITLGEIGEIKQSNRAVMHVKSYGGEPLTGLKWRGAALSQFDGTRWFAPSAPDIPVRVDRGMAILGRAPRVRPGRTFAYRVQLDEIAADTLFFAGTPETININLRELRISRGGSFHIPRLPNGITYSVYGFVEDETASLFSFTPARPVAPLGDNVRHESLRLPELDPRIPELAQAMTSGAQSDQERARSIENKLRHDYGYTLQLPRSPVADPLANFLFVRRKGHCEYFASAMAVMLRTLGIPSRVVTGFQSGVFNPITESQLIRASDAHSWVEAWIPNSGWMAFDPTPSDPNAASTGVATEISMYLDAAEQFWQDWVLSYDMQRQYTLAARMQQSGRSLHLPWFPANMSRAKLLAGLRSAATLLAPVALVIFLWPFAKRLLTRRASLRRAQRGEGQASDATLLYQRMLAVLEMRGFRKPAWQTPTEFVRAMPPASETALLVEDLTSAYHEFRFGGRADIAPRMLRLLARLQSLPR